MKAALWHAALLMEVRVLVCHGGGGGQCLFGPWSFSTKQKRVKITQILELVSLGAKHEYWSCLKSIFTWKDVNKSCNFQCSTEI